MVWRKALRKILVLTVPFIPCRVFAATTEHLPDSWVNIAVFLDFGWWESLIKNMLPKMEHIIEQISSTLRAQNMEVTLKLNKETLGIALGVFLAIAFLIHWWYSKAHPVYLLGYHCFKPPERMKVSQTSFMEKSKRLGLFTDESLSFQEKLISRSGLGNETYLPDGLHAYPVDTSVRSARLEAEMVMFTCVEEVLKKHHVEPSEVDILIVNCSLFNPTPSLAAMIVNHFKMRSNIVSYNLAGMGCSAGVISVALAQELLQVHANSNCLIISTENITQNWYMGNQRSMLIPNCLFRVGGAALLLSNKSADGCRAQYTLLHCVRLHSGANDAAYRCVFQEEDAEGRVGVHLSKDLMAVAGRALKANIVSLGHVALPKSEQLRFLVNLIGRKVMGSGAKPYLPNFQKAFQHFCLHTGGRGVIDEIQKQLKLSDGYVHPSRQTLHRYGNISSSSVWYVLAQIESSKGVRRGDKVWQIAFGSGFKSNSAVWQAMQNVRTRHEAWL